MHVQWNPSTPDTIGTTVSLISAVSLFQGVDLYIFVLILFVAKPSVRISGVSGVRGFTVYKSMLLPHSIKIILSLAHEFAPDGDNCIL